MQGSFTSQTYNMSALLGRNSFPNYTAKCVVVPTFQRSYSWEPTHVATFWDDVFAFYGQLKRAGAQETYFLGPIVILPGSDQVTLLDGQQRLATATILLAAIRDIARAKGGQAGSDFARDIQRDLIMLDDDRKTYALTLGELDEPYFRATVQQDPPDTHTKARLRSHRLIAQARKYLSTKLQDMTKDLDVKELVPELKELERVVASRLKLVAIEVGSEEEAFLIFETLNDRGLKLAVPDLVLNHLTRTANDDTERKRIREHWNLVVENLGQQKVSTFIRHMWVSRYGDVKTQGLFREIRDSLSASKVSSLEFAELCAKESKLYAGITNVDTKIIGPDSAKQVDGLVNFIEADRALPVLLSGAVCLEPPEFAKLAKAAATIVVRHSLLADLNPVDLETKLYAAARALRTKHEQGGSSKASLREAKEILRSIQPTREQIRTALRGVHLTKKQAQYMLTALAECAQSKTKVVELQMTSIEHVFPENAELGDWPNAEELEPYIWHIGNLTVLEPTYNREAGRKGYHIKKAIYTQSAIAMTQDIANRYPSWDVESIMHHAAGLMPLIDEVWPESI